MNVMNGSIRMDIKNKLKILITMILLMALVSGCAFFEEGPIDYVSHELNVKVDGKLAKDNDTHGGFLGDGENLIIINNVDNGFLKQIKDNSEWTSEPTKLETVLLYGGEYGDMYRSEPVVGFDDEKPIIPKIKNAYYYFRDRQTDEKEKNVLERYSYNFTIAVYDVERKILYYYELDT